VTVLFADVVRRWISRPPWARTLLEIMNRSGQSRDGGRPMRILGAVTSSPARSHGAFVARLHWKTMRCAHCRAALTPKDSKSLAADVQNRDGSISLRIGLNSGQVVQVKISSSMWVHRHRDQVGWAADGVRVGPARWWLMLTSPPRGWSKPPGGGPGARATFVRASQRARWTECLPAAAGFTARESDWTVAPTLVGRPPQMNNERSIVAAMLCRFSRAWGTLCASSVCRASVEPVRKRIVALARSRGADVFRHFLSNP